MLSVNILLSPCPPCFSGSLVPMSGLSQVETVSCLGQAVYDICIYVAPNTVGLWSLDDICHCFWNINIRAQTRKNRREPCRTAKALLMLVPFPPQRREAPVLLISSSLFQFPFPVPGICFSRLRFHPWKRTLLISYWSSSFALLQTVLQSTLHITLISASLGQCQETAWEPVFLPPLISITGVKSIAKKMDAVTLLYLGVACSLLSSRFVSFALWS